MTEIKKPQDLEERTLQYSKRIINLVHFLPKNSINFRFGDQILRSGTSIGANYREAQGAESRNEFKFRISICKKEARESLYWIDLISENNPKLKEKLSLLRQETEELIKIFSSICHKLK